MIAAIADDFSGAAEIAGIAWRYGLKTVLQTEMDLSANAEVIVVDTGSRSMNQDEAGYVHKSLSNNLIKSNIDWIFKKTDSVLRGHIVTEIESLNAELKMKKVLLIANNPSAGKIIRNNFYYIDDVELSQTDFRYDPDYPTQISKVEDILGPKKSLPIKSIDSPNLMKGKGFFVPDIAIPEELTQWASAVSNDILPAGGSEFFEALLNTKQFNPVKRPAQEIGIPNKNRFFVFASTAEKSRDTVVNLKNRGVPVCDLPCEPVEAPDLSDDCLKRWVDDIKGSFDDNLTVVSAIFKPVINSPGFPQRLNQFISKMIEKILQSTKIDELLIEGGATASHFVRHMGWREFTVSSEYTTGVAELSYEQKPDFRLIVKPGSYSWPDKLL
jgi:uncharacterized protein YgbK (DUF1537 family)